jgi:hypothetical protein
MDFIELRQADDEVGIAVRDVNARQKQSSVMYRPAPPQSK